MTATTKFKFKATDEEDTHEPDKQDPTLVGTTTRRKRAAGGTGVHLRDVLINVSLETLIRVGRLARAAREISSATMQHDNYNTESRGVLTQSRLSESLYTNSFVHCSKQCSLFKAIVYREFEREEVGL
jgi:hypothetical protein